MFLRPPFEEGVEGLRSGAGMDADDVGGDAIEIEQDGVKPGRHQNDGAGDLISRTLAIHGVFSATACNGKWSFGARPRA